MAHYHNVHEKAETSILQDESSFLPRELFGQRRMVACLLIIDKSCSDLPPFVHLWFKMRWWKLFVLSF
jgi:hypothetical protein